MTNSINNSQDGSHEKSKESKNINPLLVVATATVLSLTQVQASDLLSQCDVN
ncbi:MAG: hypothetical protein U9R50_06970 [Campylobacterota bacterium]|nr:hypothetical protein [Campylobacterota bacterium]